MANSTQGTTEVAAAVSAKATKVVALVYEVMQVLDFNSDKSIDWAAVQLPAYIAEDADGNIDGFKFSRTQAANAIGSLDQFRKLLMNEAVSQGDHLGNLNLVANVS